MQITKYKRLMGINNTPHIPERMWGVLLYLIKLFECKYLCTFKWSDIVKVIPKEEFKFTVCIND